MRLCTYDTDTLLTLLWTSGILCTVVWLRLCMFVMNNCDCCMHPYAYLSCTDLSVWDQPNPVLSFVHCECACLCLSAMLAAEINAHLTFMSCTHQLLAMQHGTCRLTWTSVWTACVQCSWTILMCQGTVWTAHYQRHGVRCLMYVTNISASIHTAEEKLLARWVSIDLTYTGILLLFLMSRNVMSKDCNNHHNCRLLHIALKLHMMLLMFINSCE